MTVAEPALFFDAHLLAPPAPPESVPTGLSGAVLFGVDAAAGAQQLAALAPDGVWRAVAALACVVGPEDVRFPTGPFDVIDLQLDAAELAARLRRPAAEWYALCGRPVSVHWNLPPGPMLAKGVKCLARKFPQARFIVDPFRHGPSPGWEAQVRLAECDNVWLTTLGLFPGAACAWPSAADVREALYYVVGEVGAGKLLFASGRRWEELAGVAPEDWLREYDFLEIAQQALILSGNVRRLLAVA
jgi:hypothetical protein